jgi:dihydroxy-acid dehydratase
MAKGLRSRLSQYGDEAFALFLRRGFLKSAGYTDEALDRPVVGILSTASDFNPCHGNAGQLAEHIARGVRLAGGLPFVFPTISIHESFSFPTSMLLRNLMSMDTEEMLRALPIDAVVMIGGCDKTIPAQVMAAASSEVPALILPTGPMDTGNHRGERLGACTDCRRIWAQYRADRIDAAEVAEINDKLASSVGTCTVMGTASTMAALVEAMGLALPMAASAPATSSARMRLAEQSGRAAVAMAESGLTTAEVLTPGALHNGLVTLQALGGSTNAVVHLAAIYGRLGLKLDLGELDAIGRQVPVLVDLKPSGSGYMGEFHAAGGVPRLLSELTDLLDLAAPRAFGGTLGDSVTGLPPRHEDRIIRPRAHPIASAGAIAVLSGNLAPGGAIIKHSAADPRLLMHEGRAVVFDSIQDMSDRLDDPAL